MDPFDLDISNPFPEGYTGELGGPGVGGHTGPNWFIAFGNDLGADAGTAVHAVYDGQITKIDRTHIDATTGPVYGAGIFVQAISDVLEVGAPGGVGCYYTHVTLADDSIVEGATIDRGQVIGEVIEVPGISPHLHFAIAERRGGTNFGVDIFQLLVSTGNTSDVITLTFFQNGDPPGASFAEDPDESPFEEDF